MREALAFLTPFGGARTPTPKAVAWFPVVGALIGLLLGLVWEGASEVWIYVVPAALVVVADLALTGMLHMDGLADTADGVLPHLSRDRRLEVMSQPDVGAFGLVVVAATLLLRFAALTNLEGLSGPDIALLVALWTTSRSVMAIGLTAMPYAREAGLASVFGGSTALTSYLAPIAAVLLVHDLRRGAAVAAALLAGSAVLLLAQRRLGGYTGDVLGAAGVAAETAGLLVAAVRW